MSMGFIDTLGEVLAQSSTFGLGCCPGVLQSLPLTQALVAEVGYNPYNPDSMSTLPCPQVSIHISKDKKSFSASRGRGCMGSLPPGAHDIFPSLSTSQHHA